VRRWSLSADRFDIAVDLLGVLGADGRMVARVPVHRRRGDTAKAA
jgi:hypothetical protein